MRTFLLFIVFLNACTGPIDLTTDIHIEDIAGIKAIASAKYKDHYLSIDNGEFFGSTYGDQGKVSVTQQLGQKEIFKITKYRDAMEIYSIESTDVRQRFLFMDGGAITPASTQPGGRIGIHIYIGQFGQFKIKKLAASSYAFESVFFPGRYLSMSKDKVQIFNTIGEEERFLLLDVESNVAN